MFKLTTWFLIWNNTTCIWITGDTLYSNNGCYTLIHSGYYDTNHARKLILQAKCSLRVASPCKNMSPSPDTKGSNDPNTSQWSSQCWVISCIASLGFLLVNGHTCRRIAGQWKWHGSLQCRQILSFLVGVSRFQGRRGIHPISTFQVRSNSRGATGFVGQRQRLCVLLTRARRELMNWRVFPLGCWWWLFGVVRGAVRMKGHEVS